MRKANLRKMAMVLLGGGLLALLVALLLWPRHGELPLSIASTTTTAHVLRADKTSTNGRPRVFPRSTGTPPATAPTAEEIVARKVTQFAQSRRKLAHAMAEHFKVPMLDDMERFFDAAEAGRYDEMNAIYTRLKAKRDDPDDKTDFGPQWRTVIETAGAMDQAH